MCDALNELHQKLDQLLLQRAAPSRWMRVNEAAEYCRLSKESIRRLYGSGKLTPHRPVDAILLDRLEIDAVFEASTSTPRKGRGRQR